MIQTLIPCVRFLGFYHVILGADWMKKQNPISLDFEKLQVVSMKEGEKVLIQGVSNEGSFRHS